MRSRRRWLACAAAAAALLLAPASAGAAGPVSSHAMVHTCCDPYELKERIFAESKALGASYIRVDFELNVIFRDGQEPDWVRVDEVLALARRYELQVLGIVLDTPAYISACPERPSPESGRCAAADLEEYGRIVGELAGRGRGTVSHWEIINEPDGAWAFQGSPQDYARMLSASYDAIKARVPEATVAMGGVMNPWTSGWVDQVFATEGAEAARKFDIANVHLRGPAAGLPRGLGRWRATMARHGFNGPIWVTEHGYSADPAFQTDDAYRGGEAEQVAYLERSLLGLAEAGAEQIFVTLRDEGDADYAAEGLTHIDQQSPYASHRRPAFEAVRRFGERWVMIPEWRARQHAHERSAGVADALATSAELRIQGLTITHAHAMAALRRERAQLRRLRRCARAARLGRRVCRGARRSCARAAASRRRRCLKQVSRRLGRRIAEHASRVRHLRLETGEIAAQLQAEAIAAQRHRSDARTNALMAIDYANQIGG
jgi:hypothetical protein